MATPVSPSTNSGASSPGSSLCDAVKYQKLASEYAKLRAQFAVLKKAVKDEQQRNNDLNDEIRSKDLAERKAEAELDSLQFRNQQLTKRIHVLQQDNSAQVLSKVDEGVLGDELKAKIDENARLHAQLTTVDKKYESVIQGFQEKINRLENELKKAAQKDRAEESLQKDLIQGLKCENVQLLNQIQELKNAKATANSNSIPLNATESRIQSVELLSQLSENVTDLTAAFSDFHTYYDDSNEKLKANLNYVKPIEEAFQTALAKILSKEDSISISYFRPLAVAFKAYVDYACQVEQFMNSDQLFFTALRSFNRVLVRLSDYLIDLRKDPVNAVENINVVINELHLKAVDLAGVYTEKAANEVSPNQCLIAALTSMAASIQGLSRQIADNLPRIINLVGLAEKSEIQEEPEKDFEETETELKISSMEEARKSLQNALKQTEEKLKTLEQNRDHWKLEFQLLEMKFKKLNNDQVEVNGEEEADLKKPFESRISELISSRLMSDGKAVSLSAECAALKRRLESADCARSRLTANLAEAEKRSRSAQSEAAFTAKNYESQLSVMSEHLANMNDKLTQQTDEINILKQKKGKK